MPPHAIRGANSFNVGSYLEFKSSSLLPMQTCVRSLAAQQSIGPIMAGMKARPDAVGIACEALNNLFSKGQEDLVSQALNCDIIPYLLSLLDGKC